MTIISANLQAVLERITAAARKYERDPASISLLAVSKTKPASDVCEAAAAGQKIFGENYVQEGLDKISALTALELEWHFIGPLQSNKTRPVADAFDWVHSVDRLKIAQRLSEQRPESMPSLQICLQVNVSQEGTKSGVGIDEVESLAFQLARLPRLTLRGLMAIPAPCEDFKQQRLAFRRVREIYERLVAAGLKLDTLSMGMTHDLEAAIAEGSTLARVGTAIFGKRSRT